MYSALADNEHAHPRKDVFRPRADRSSVFIHFCCFGKFRTRTRSLPVDPLCCTAYVLAGMHVPHTGTPVRFWPHEAPQLTLWLVRRCANHCFIAHHHTGQETTFRQNIGRTCPRPLFANNYHAAPKTIFSWHMRRTPGVAIRWHASWSPASVLTTYSNGHRHRGAHSGWYT